jgi:hypothetical protein
MNNWAMLSVGVIIDEGEIKGVVAVAAGSSLSSYGLHLQQEISDECRA